MDQMLSTNTAEQRRLERSASGSAQNVAAHSVCSPPQANPGLPGFAQFQVCRKRASPQPAGEGLGVGVDVILFGAYVDVRERRAALGPNFLARNLPRTHMRTCHRVLTATPTPNP